MEIEVKAKVADLSAIRARIVALGCTFTDPVVQDDTGYVRNVGSMDAFLGNDVFLRIRVQSDGRVMYTAKKPSRFAGDGLAKTEHEVTVSSAEELTRILELSGFVRAVHVRKSRQTAHYNQYEICLDEIEGLGSFIEVEVIGEEVDADSVQQDMRAFLQTLGIRAEDQVRKGYDILILEREYGIQ
jgi:adenylate cyclase class 2